MPDFTVSTWYPVIILSVSHMPQLPLDFNYSEIPNFPVSTVEGHSGKLIFGKLGNKDIMAMQGRFHFYEGYDMQKVTMPIRVFRALGIKNLIVTNACGGVRDDLNPGQIVIISDHLSFMMPSPLRGPNLDDFGPRFKDMTDVYTSTFKFAGNCLGINSAPLASLRTNHHKGACPLRGGFCPTRGATAGAPG